MQILGYASSSVTAIKFTQSAQHLAVHTSWLPLIVNVNKKYMCQQQDRGHVSWNAYLLYRVFMLSGRLRMSQQVCYEML